MSCIPEIAVQNLDHLGLVAGLIDEIGIFERINQLVGEKPGEIVSPGHAVKAMICNCSPQLRCGIANEAINTDGKTCWFCRSEKFSKAKIRAG